MRKVWSQAELEFVRNNYATMSDEEMTEKIIAMRGKLLTVASVRKQRQRMGLGKLPGGRMK
jgi:hypothetical protein